MRRSIAVLAAWPLLLPSAFTLRANLHTVRAAAASRVPFVASVASDSPIRIGHGYDIHRIDTVEVAGQPLTVGGVKFDGSTAPVGFFVYAEQCEGVSRPPISQK